MAGSRRGSREEEEEQQGGGAENQRLAESIENSGKLKQNEVLPRADHAKVQKCKSAKV